MLPVSAIYPHPDNPRKDVGDVTELADSIKKRGILQNLTVMPGHWLTMDEILLTFTLIGTTEFVIGLLLLRKHDKLQEENDK